MIVKSTDQPPNLSIGSRIKPTDRQKQWSQTRGARAQVTKRLTADRSAAEPYKTNRLTAEPTAEPKP